MERSHHRRYIGLGYLYVSLVSPFRCVDFLRSFDELIPPLPQAPLKWILITMALLLLLLCVAYGQNQVADEHCPCSSNSALCMQCKQTRCEIGGSALSSWLQREPWALKAGQVWTAHCSKLAKGGAAPRTMCEATESPCGSVCAAEEAGCHESCGETLVRAVHACASFPWPTPIKSTLALQHLPDVFT